MTSASSLRGSPVFPCRPLCGKFFLFMLCIYSRGLSSLNRNSSSFILRKLSQFAAQFIFQEPLFCEFRPQDRSLQHFLTGDFLEEGSPPGQQERCETNSLPWGKALADAACLKWRLATTSGAMVAWAPLFLWKSATNWTTSKLGYQLV